MYGRVFGDVLYMYNTDRMGADPRWNEAESVVRRMVCALRHRRILVIYGHVFGDVLYMYNTDHATACRKPFFAHSQKRFDIAVALWCQTVVRTQIE